MTVATEPPGLDSLTPSLESHPFSKRDITTIVLVWIVLAIAIDPCGDFPLNDDWGFGLPVKALVERGEIRFTEWICPTLIAQVF
jgi:hypothetical protein